LDALKDFTIELLLAAAIVSLIIGIVESEKEGWYEGISILVAVAIVVSVASTQDYLKELQFRKLNEEIKRLKIAITRNGVLEEIFQDDIVVGDLVSLNPGDITPADGILVRSYGIIVDESAMTGESISVKKGEHDPFILSSSVIVEGTGDMIVCAVGKNSLAGRSHLFLLKQDKELTPLQMKLEKVAKHIGIAGAIAAAIIFVFISFFIFEGAIADDDWESDDTSDLLTAFILAVTILVVAIPEGLPLAVTLSLAFSMRKMKDEKIFVKHLSACETMGGCEELLIDKTGTITKNEMRVVKFRIGLKKIDIKTPIKDKNLAEIIAKSIARNTTADIRKIEEKLIKTGSRTECALLMFLSDWGYNFRALRDLDTQAMQIPFSSESKKMTTFHVGFEKEGYLYVKGAPERVIEKCKYYFKEDGTISELSEEVVQEFNNLITEWSQKMIRTLALAYRPGTLENLQLSERPSKEDIENAEKNMILIGIFGIEDPLREEARSALNQLKNAGVTVRMITGDSKEIAAKIGKQCDILEIDYELHEKSQIISGKDFTDRVEGVKEEFDEIEKKRYYKIGNEEEFNKVSASLRILARCSPYDKFVLTIGMRNSDKIVGVTGDGTNDSLALKSANIGIAMMTATPMAKESSDIILLDDNIENIVTAVRWGRNIYQNIRRFLQFQLTVNIVALLLCLIGAVSVASCPLSAVQMLWVNLLMDSLAALALATQDPDDRVLDSKPYGKNEYILSSWIIANIIVQAVYQMVIMMVILYLGPYIFGIDAGWDSDWPDEESTHYTICFNTFVMLQLFNQINCRKTRAEEYNVFSGIFKNRIFLSIFSIEFALQIIFVQLGGDFMNTEPLDLYQILICIMIGSSTLAVTLLFKVSTIQFYERKSD